MQRSLRRSSQANDPEDRRIGETSPAVLEFLSPSAAVAVTPIPRGARASIWVVGSMFAACIAALGLIPIDRVVTAHGRVVSQGHTIVVQPLETAIIRSIAVHEGQEVHPGDLLARLDPTFAGADVNALQAQVASFQAEVSRLEAEVAGREFRYMGSDPYLTLQAALASQRESERSAKLDAYSQKIEGLKAAAARAAVDAKAFAARLSVAQDLEAMRKKLEELKAGSHFNSLVATDNRLEVERNLDSAGKSRDAAEADLSAMRAERDAYIENWRSQTTQTLTEEARKLNDAREALNKALLRRQLVDLRAVEDATVLTIAKLSPGSVLQPGQQFITLVPLGSPLEIEADIIGRESGFVHVGDEVAIKFDTFPFSQYGIATGNVRVISPDSFAPSDPQRGARIDPPPAPESSSEPFYRARITIESVKLHDVPSHFKLIPGMPVTTDIRVGRHTVLSYLLARVLATASEGMREP